MFVGQVVFAREDGGGVAGVHRAVAVSQLRPLACGATFRVGFADDDRLASEFGIRRHDAEAVLDGAQLCRDAHADVVIRIGGRAFGVEGNEVERGAHLASRVVGSAQAVLDEIARELSAAARGVRAAHACRG